MRHYMQGDALENRINDATSTAFEVIDKINGEFDPEEHVNFLIGNILTGLCFGGKYSFDDKDLQYILKKDDEFIEVFGIGTAEDYIPGLKYVYKTNQFKKVEGFSAEIIDDFMTTKYLAEKKTFNKDNVRHFCDTLLLAREEAIEEEGQIVADSLTEDHLVQTLSDIFFAGIDTSRMTLYWAIKHMIAYPDIQAKVQQEIDSSVGKHRLPGVEDRPNLGYTEAVLHESMRLSSVLPIGVFHVAACDTEIVGHKIPKGTVVGINHYALHHDPDAWEDVDRFIPERYLDENGKLGPKPKNWLPFSAGKRVCLGEFVAKPELHLIFAQLMQRYKWKMVSGKCADLTPAGSCFSRLASPYKVIVEKRI
ncbi:cytochrome P450 2 subfamily U member 1 [Mactra antiquata]